jgi:GT2 family glycosyltransferase
MTTHMPASRNRASRFGEVLRTAFARTGERSFAGYVVDHHDLTCKFTVEILVDGYPVKVLRAESEAPPLAREQIGDGAYGFSVWLDEAVVHDGAVVEARLANLSTPVGVPILLDAPSEAEREVDGTGAVRWLGGLRFCGWTDQKDEGAADVLVDGTLVTRVRSTAWTHVGNAETARAVRALEFHLPPRFADGAVHRLVVVNESGEPLSGCPLSFLAFADGLRAILEAQGVSCPDQIRAEMFDRLLPMAVPFPRYQEWCEQAPIPSPTPVTLQVAIVMVGPGAVDSTLDSLNAQAHSDWVAAGFREDDEPTGFDPKLLLNFLDRDAASSDLILFVLAGSVLAPAALQRITAAFIDFPNVAAIYGDVDIAAADGSIWPLAFSAFDYERMLEQGYCAHQFALRRAAVERAIARGATNLYRLFNVMLDDGPPAVGDIVHLPGALCTLPPFDRTAAAASLARASAEHCRRRGIRAEVMPGLGGVLPAARIARNFEWRRTTIVIPTRNRRSLLESCIDSLKPAVARVDAEILVVDNDSSDPDTLAYLTAIDNGLARVLRVPGDFNFSRLNNRAAEAATGDLLCLLNNDLRALDANWLEEMLSLIAAQDVGAVGALLQWPSGLVQHGGVVLGPGFEATYAFRDRLVGDGGYGDLLRVTHEVSAVTAACLVTRRCDYLDVGGLDELRFPVNFNDVDYCLKLRARGRRIVFTPHARLEHLESASRGRDRAADSRGRLARELRNLRTKWGDVLAADPYYSPALSLDLIPFSALAWPPRSMAPRTSRPPVPADIPPGF